MAKSHQLHFQDSTTLYSQPLQLVFINVWGPSPVPASNGACYYISFLNAYSKYVQFYLLHTKSQVQIVFKSFKLYCEKKTGFQIQSIQIDNAKEFLCLKSYLANHGIKHGLICPHTHEKNSSIERKHRHIVDMGLALLARASLPLTFWEEVFTTAATIINVLPSTNINYNNPYQLLFNRTPDYQFFKTFGCACYPLLRPYKKLSLLLDLLSVCFLDTIPLKEL